jgi:DNA-binding beta-propeller fold protein YncE
MDAFFETVLANIPLGGMPSAIVPSYKGRIYITLSDKDQLLVMDTRKYKISKRFNIFPGETPVSIAVDSTRNRVFIVCRKRTLVVVNPSKGNIVSILPVGDQCNSVIYNPYTQTVFATDNSGALTIFKQFNASRYRLAQRLDAGVGAGYPALDINHNRLYILRTNAAPNASSSAACELLSIGAEY